MITPIQMITKLFRSYRQKFRAALKALPDSAGLTQQGREEEEKGVDGIEKTMTSAFLLTELEEHELDLTSKLPDDVVIHLLSFLNLKEAIRTSVLSGRWRDLWKSANLALDFEAEKELLDIYNGWIIFDDHAMVKYRMWYKNAVNGVVRQLQQHNRATKHTKFRVGFTLTNPSNYDGDIDRWVEYAISKRVECLDLTFYVRCKGDTRKLYVFSEACYNHIKTPDGLSDVKSLRSLRLNCVAVRTDILEHFISSCPLLEELAVARASNSLKKLRVVGSSQSPLRLKYLELRYLDYLKSLEIDHTPCLVRLIYDECLRMEELRVGNCPGLVDLNLGLHSRYNFAFEAFSGCASQLKSLLLKTNSILGKLLSHVAEHPHLERLMIQVNGGGNRSLVELIPLVNACPRLHTLQVFLHTSRCAFEFCDQDVVHTKMTRESIKVVEIVGFRGYEMDCQLVEYIMEYFVGLKRIVIDRAIETPFFYDEWLFGGKKIKACTQADADDAEKLALGFKSRAPPALEFIVI
ncbi:unnamed protein product [Linum tenue]|uniref:F-box domain-containing protein n=1 Tax=Linum tenue TaxID=586396 RepID=A0AAV0RXJ0_9ROSI|nr:unnamed protein product [Linum tenue]